MGGRKGEFFPEQENDTHTSPDACLSGIGCWMHCELPFLERVSMLLAKVLNTHGNQSLNNCLCPRDILPAQT